MLYQEIENLKKLKQKYIVNYNGIHHDNKSLSLLMQYVKGGSIFNLISKEGTLQEKDMSKYCQQILDGLAYIHESKIVHRDLKCAVLLDKCRNV